MDDIDEFLSSLDQFSAPSLSAGLQRLQQQQQQQLLSSSSSQPLAGTGAPQAWRCPRCTLENNIAMESCAGCHRRRRDEYMIREEAPPNAPTTTTTVTTSSSSSSLVSGVPAPVITSSSAPRSGDGGGDERATGGMTRVGRRRMRDPQEPHNNNNNNNILAAAQRSLHSTNGQQQQENGNGNTREVACPRCTFLNSPSRRACEMCEGPLPRLEHRPATRTTTTTTTAQLTTSSNTDLRGRQPTQEAAHHVHPLSSLSHYPHISNNNNNNENGVPAPIELGVPLLQGMDGPEGHRGPPSSSLPCPLVSDHPRNEENDTAARSSLSRASSLDRIHARVGSFSSSSSDSGSLSDSEEDDDDEDDEEDEDDEGEVEEAVTARNLVQMLDRMQSAKIDDLVCADVPPSMRARSELRPFQLQALHWLLIREGREPSFPPPPPHNDHHHHSGEKDEQEKKIQSSAEEKFVLLEESGDEVDEKLPEQNTDPSEKTNSNDDTEKMKNGTPEVLGGIFADYMGLGKTRTLIALCEATRGSSVDRVTGSLLQTSATLIVCPASLLLQWKNEIERCVFPHTPRILLYYGHHRKRRTLFQLAQDFDYVLTTYATLAHEPRPQLRSQSLRENHHHNFSNNFNISSHLQTEVGKLFMIQWTRVILDEAHYIRNNRTRQCGAAMCLNSPRRWAVTATPVQNSLNDLYALLKFLQVPLFSVLAWWNREIVRNFNVNPRHPRVVTALSILFQSILLRRTPTTLVNGVPLLHLPPKEIIQRRIALSRDEMRFYESIHVSAKKKIDRLRSEGGLGRDGSALMTFSTLFEMLIRCRQTCLHPYIVVAALRRLRPAGTPSASAAAGNGAGTSSSSDQTAAAQQQAELTRALLDKFILTVRRKLRVSDTSDFVQALVEELRAQKLEERECIICLETVHHPAILPCAHVYCAACIHHAVQAMKKCPLCKRTTKEAEILEVPDDFLSAPSTSSTTSAGASAGLGESTGAERPGQGEEKGREPPPEVPAGLDLTNQANWPLSLTSKTQYLIDYIKEIPPHEKVVVFSNFLTYLRCAKYWIEKETGARCCLYSGALTMRQKEKMLEDFRGESGDVVERELLGEAPARVLLATITTGNVGLNLTCANHCILMEPSWNPGTEEQALNRIHRIGQTRPVRVVKLVAEDTVEQNIDALCQKKKELSGLCFGTGGFGAAVRLRVEDLVSLFVSDDSDSDAETSSEDSDEEDDDFSGDSRS